MNCALRSVKRNVSLGQLGIARTCVFRINVKLGHELAVQIFTDANQISTGLLYLFIDKGGNLPRGDERKSFGLKLKLYPSKSLF